MIDIVLDSEMVKVYKITRPVQTQCNNYIDYIQIIT